MENIKKIISVTLLMVILIGSSAVNASAEPETIWLDKSYDILTHFNEGLTKVNIDGIHGSHGFINKSGKLVISPKYDANVIYNTKFSEGLSIMANGRPDQVWGYIDKTGKEAISLEYSSVKDFSEGLAAVQVPHIRHMGRWLFIDKTGKEIITLPENYRYVESFSEGLSAVRMNGSGMYDSKTAYIDKTGEIVIPFKDYWSSEFKDGMAMVMANNRKRGYIDKTGKQVIPSKYYEAKDFSDGLAAVQVSNVGNWGYIDKTGKEVVSLKYKKAESFSEGLAAVKILDDKDGKFKWGYIDKSGKEVITPAYEDVLYGGFENNFSEGLAMVKSKGKFGYINKSGKVVIPIKYDSAYRFNEGVAIVELNGINGIIKNPLAKEENQISVYINNEKLDMPINPIMQQGRTLVPLRAIFEAMGASVDWDQATKTVTGIKDDKEIKLQIGNKAATINGNSVNLDVPAVVIKGNTLVPTRFIAESLGAKVEWDGSTRSVMINY